jgi:hypothetical protein
MHRTMVVTTVQHPVQAAESLIRSIPYPDAIIIEIFSTLSILQALYIALLRRPLFLGFHIFLMYSIVILIPISRVLTIP